MREWLSSFSRHPVAPCTYGVIHWKNAPNINRICLGSIKVRQESKAVSVESSSCHCSDRIGSKQRTRAAVASQSVKQQTKNQWLNCKMDLEDHYCVRWKGKSWQFVGQVPSIFSSFPGFHSNIVNALEDLKSDETFVDVTLSCEGETIQVNINYSSESTKHLHGIIWLILINCAVTL